MSHHVRVRVGVGTALIRESGGTWRWSVTGASGLQFKGTGYSSKSAAFRDMWTAVSAVVAFENTPKKGQKGKFPDPRN